MEGKKCICCHKTQDSENFSPKNWKSQYELDRDNICDKCKRYHLKTMSYKIDLSHREKPNYYNKYNISQKEYNFLFAHQEGKCKICNTHQSELAKKLVVDHCHETNHVRGLLCSSCNLALGLFKDNIKSLEKAIIYLKLTSNSHSENFNKKINAILARAYYHIYINKNTCKI